MEWIKKKIKFIFTRNVSTEQLTLSIVLGITLGLFPVPFMTTFVCLFSTFFVSVNVPIMTAVNLLVTPIELAMIPLFVMMGNYLKYYGNFNSNLDVPSANISDLMASLKQNAFQGVRDFADVLLVAIIAWSIFQPIASFILYYALKPIVAKLIVKFQKQKSTD
eukprot:UN03227